MNENINMPVMGYRFRVRTEYTDESSDQLSCNLIFCNVDMINKSLTLSVRQTVDIDDTISYFKFMKGILKCTPSIIIDLISSNPLNRYYGMVFNNVKVCKYDIPFEYANGSVLTHTIVASFSDFSIEK